MALVTLEETRAAITDALTALKEIEAEFPDEVADARRYHTLSGRLRSELKERRERVVQRGAGIDVGAAFDRALGLSLVKGVTTVDAMLEDAVLREIAAGNVPTVIDDLVVQSDIYQTLEGVLRSALKTWGTVVERHQNALVATLQHPTLSATQDRATLTLTLDNVDAWTCALRLYSAASSDAARVFIQQRRGMRALMRRKKAGKSGAELVRAVFSVEESPRQPAFLAALAPHSVPLENDHVTVELSGHFAIEFPFCTVTPSEVVRVATAMGNCWDAYERWRAGLAEDAA